MNRRKSILAFLGLGTATTTLSVEPPPAVQSAQFKSRHTGGYTLRKQVGDIAYTGETATVSAVVQ